MNSKKDPEPSQKKVTGRGLPPTRGVYVFVTQEGQISHQFRGEPPLNEAELLGLGQYLVQLFSLSGLESIQIGLGLALKKIDQLIPPLAEGEPVSENAATEKTEAVELAEDQVPPK